MASLKDTVVSGSLRATDTIYSTTNQFQILRIPTSSGGTAYGVGTNGQILKSNGSSVYWASDNATDNTKLPLTGGTLTGDLLFSNSGTAIRQIQGIAGDNDYWRIAGGATGSNGGWMEIATADNGTEPIYVRQYTGVYTTIARTLTLLDSSGNTTLPGLINMASSSNIYNSSDAPILYFSKDKSPITDNKLGAIFMNYGTTNNIHRADRFYFRNYTYNSSTGVTSEYWDQYYLPAAMPDSTSARSYAILTSRNAVTIAQGGTGATTAANARTNLGLGSLATKNSLIASDIPDISSTYLKLTGGTLTGVLNFKNNTVTTLQAESSITDSDYFSTKVYTTQNNDIYTELSIAPLSSDSIHYATKLAISDGTNLTMARLYHSGNIIYSSTAPTDADVIGGLAEGMIWLQPI